MVVLDQSSTRAASPRTDVRWPWVQIVIFIVALVLFFVPLVASASFGFSLPGKPFTLEPLAVVGRDSAFLPGLLSSIQLAILATLCSLVLLVPTLLWLHLRAPRLLPLAEWLSIVPYVIPAIALVGGASLFFRAVAPGFLVSIYSLVPFYVILALPLTYRSIDAGMRALDLKTLYSASISLGAGALHTLVRAILPNLKTALLSASLLCVAMVLGEFVLASLLLHSTFPVYMVQIGASQPRTAAALSFLAVLGTWLILIALSLATRRNTTPRTSRVKNASPKVGK